MINVKLPHFLTIRSHVRVQVFLSVERPSFILIHLDFQEACNLVAKASGEGRASPLVLSGTSAGVNVGVAGAGGVNPYEPWEMTPREREVASKYLKVV